MELTHTPRKLEAYEEATKQYNVSVELLSHRTDTFHKALEHASERGLISQDAIARAQVELQHNNKEHQDVIQFDAKTNFVRAYEQRGGDHNTGRKLVFGDKENTEDRPTVAPWTEGELLLDLFRRRHDVDEESERKKPRLEMHDEHDEDNVIVSTTR